MGNFKGLTIEITGDATQLESVLLSIKRTSRSVQSEIEAVGKAMKLDPTNMALANKYYDSMADKLSLTQKRAEAMRQEQQRLNEKLEEYRLAISGLPEGSDAYRAVEQEIAKTEEQQRQLTAKLDEYKQKLQSLKADADSYARIQKAADAAEKKQAELADKIALYRQELRGLEPDSAAYKAVERQLKNATNQQKILTDRLNNYKKSLKNLKGNATAYDEIKAKIDKAEAEQKELTAKLEEYKLKLSGLKEGSDAYNHVQQQIEKTEYKLRDLATQTLTTETDIKQLESTMRLLNIKNATDGIAGWGNDLVAQGKSMQAIGDQLVSLTDAYSKFYLVAMTLGAPRLIRSVEEYGNVIAQVGGYLDITGESLESMSELALYTGKETIFSATEAAQAMSYLAKGGMTQAQIEAGALDATVRLAAAGQLDLADAAKVTAQAIAAFQLDAEDATKVADALAGAATNSVSSVQGISTGFTQAASWARAAGWTINDVAGALALLSDYGLEAEMGGTALRNVLLRLAAPTDDAAAAMQEYGIEVRDADGHMKSAVEVVDILARQLGGLNDADRDAIVKTIFGTRGANAALALVDAGSAALQGYIDKTNELGAAERMAQAQLGELGWALEYLRGEAETAAVNFGNALTPVLVDLAKAAEDTLTAFNGMSKSEREAVARNALLMVSLPVLINLFGRMTSGIGKLSVGLGETVLGIIGYRNAIAEGTDKTRAIAEAFASAAGATEATEEHMKKASSLTMGLGSAFMSLKAILIAAGVIAAIALVSSLIAEEARRSEEARKHTEKLEKATDGLRRTVNNTAPSLDNVTDAYRRMRDASEDVLASTDSLLDEFGNMSTTIQDRNREAQNSISTLSTAKDIIDEYAGAESLSTEQAAKLQWALSIVNDELGTNYELLDKNTGAIGENGEAVDDLSDSLDRLIDARIRDAKVAAITANMTDMFKAQSEAKANIDATTAAIEENRKQYEMWDSILHSEGVSDETRTKAAQNMLDLNNELENLNVALEDNQAMFDAATDGIEQYSGQLEGVISEIRTWDDVSLNLKSLMGDSFGGLGSRSGEFLDRMRAAGISVDEFTSMTADQFAALVTALNADGYKMEDMLALVTGNLDLASSDWRGIIEQWADDNGITTEQAMAAISEGIKNGEADVTHGLEGVLDSSLEAAKAKAKEKGNEVGTEAVDGTADGMTSEAAKKKAEQAASTVLRVIGGAFKKTQPMAEAGTAGGVAYGNGFTSPTAKAITGGSAASLAQFAVSKLRETGGAFDAGGKLVGEYKSGIEGSASTVASATEYIKSIAQSHLDSNGKSYEWGKHLVENFANGIEDSTWRVSNATSAIERVVALSLKHSKPRTGLLADDDVWGLHFVQNFASGIDRGIPLLERSVDGMASTLGWGINDQSLYMSAGSGYGSATAIYVDGNAIVTDARLQAASENFMRELARKADM